MKVLMVNTSETAGGAAIAAKRLMRALNRNGVEANMLVRDKTTDDAHVFALPHQRRMRLRFIAERGIVFAANRLSRSNLWAVDANRFGCDITRLPIFQEADIIHLHWVNQGLLSVGDLARILHSGKPVVWTFHDMWAFTGICHHAESCEGWRHKCGDCLLLAHPAAADLSYTTFARKEKAYKAGRINVIACSDWLADLAREAPLLKGNRVESIPNAIDTEFYVRGDKAAAREALGLPQDKKILLFIAYKATDEKKGFQYLIDAIDLVHKNYPEWTREMAVVPVGKESDKLKNAFACEAFPQDYVSDREKLRLLYQAADVLVMPTLRDNLPNTIVEGMACGLPCVGFNVGGLPQMIEDHLTGFLVKFCDVDDLAHKILNLLYSDHYDDFCRNAREKAEQNYSQKYVAERHIEFYKQVIGER